MIDGWKLVWANNKSRHNNKYQPQAMLGGHKMKVHEHIESIFSGYRHLSLKILNVEFDINALIGDSTLGFQH